MNNSVLNSILSISMAFALPALAARPDGTPTCSFTGGAYYSSTNTIYFESKAESGAELKISNSQARCINQKIQNKDYNIIVERSTALTSNSTMLLPLPYNIDNSYNNCLKMYDPTQFGRVNGEYGVIAKNETQGRPNNAMLLIADLTQNECKDVKEVKLTGVKGQEIKTVDEHTQTYHWLQNENNSGQDWNFQGVYSYTSWDENDDNIKKGFIWGYAAKDMGRDLAGQFVRAGGGAYIPPMRAYLQYIGKKTTLRKSADDSEEIELPKTINVFLVDGDGKTTKLAKWNQMTGEFKIMERNFDLNGRHIGNKAAHNGVYVGKQKVLH